MAPFTKRKVLLLFVKTCKIVSEPCFVKKELIVSAKKLSKVSLQRLHKLTRAKNFG